MGESLLKMNSNKIYIAGAHSRGATFGYYIKYLFPQIEILAYLYDNEEENPKDIQGSPVIKIDDNSKLESTATAYIGTRGVNFKQLSRTLTNCGIKNIVPVDVELDKEIRNEYLRKYYESIGREYLKITDLDFNHKAEENIGIYVVKSIFDKSLQNSEIKEKHEKTIQVGAKLTEKILCDAEILDNVGDNISDLNKQFCELTAMYWIWKNSKESIVGLEHYRRKFILPDNWEDIFVSNNVDVILPVPLYVYPSLEENYYFRHISVGWDTMLDVVENKDPEEYEDMRYYFKNNGIYSPCNMIIAKKQVFDEMCEWLFPILFECQKNIGEIEDKYQNRYPGFLSERLISYYFDKNRNKYKLVYADKCFLE